MSSLHTFQDSRGLQEQCQEEHNLGNEFAEEAQEWVKLAGRLADDVNALKHDNARVAHLREVGNKRREMASKAQ